MLQAPVTIRRGDKPEKKQLISNQRSFYLLLETKNNHFFPPSGSEAVYFEPFPAALFLICAVWGAVLETRRLGSPDEAEPFEDGRDGF